MFLSQEEYRHELKHFVDPAERAILRTRLSRLLKPDNNALGDGEYHVRSIYFDTPEDRALFEKLDGVAYREKYRIRFYNFDPSFIRLEKKLKHRGLTAKLQAPLSLEQAEAILRGEIAFLKNSDQALYRDLFLSMSCDRLQPKVIVDYRRQAFCHAAGNVRVTLDRDIRAGVGLRNAFSGDLVTIPALSQGMAILEVKYDAFLPEFIQDICQINTTQTTSASKYALCRQFA